MLRVEPGALCLLGKHSATKLFYVYTIFSLFLHLLMGSLVNSYLSCCEQFLMKYNVVVTSVICLISLFIYVEVGHRTYLPFCFLLCFVL